MPNTLRALVGLFCLMVATVPGQNLVPNSSFESGASQPADWGIYYGFGTWETTGRTSGRSVAISNSVASCTGVQWRSSPFAVAAGKPHIIDFWAVSSNAAEIVRAQVGIGRPDNFGLADRYIYPPAAWRSFPFTCMMPRNQSNVIMRLISCNGVGTQTFDDVEMYQAEPAHTMTAGGLLGVDESVMPGKYSYVPNWRDYGQGFYLANYARVLQDATGTFNTFVFWYMSGGTQFTYQHEYGGQAFTNAQVKLISVQQVGPYYIEFGTNGVNWVTLTNPTPVVFGTITNTFAVPAALLPATNIHVRVRLDPSSFYRFTDYQFTGDLPANTNTASGQSLLFAQRSPARSVWLHSTSVDGKQVQLTVGNTNVTARTYAFNCNVTGPTGSRTWTLTNAVAGKATNSFMVPFSGMGWSDNALVIEVVDTFSGTTNFSGKTYFFENVIADSSFGLSLPGTANCAVWWCDGTYKVSRDRPIPASADTAAGLSAARNEYEPVQVVLRPAVTLSNALAFVTDFVATNPANPAIVAASNVTLTLVDYVPVVTPTDYSGVPGEHPDPLIPWTTPRTISAGSNQPVWVTVYVPKGTPAGDYQATLSVQSDQPTVNVPIRLHVYDFSLSDVTHTRSAFRCGVDDFWHASTNSSMRPAIFDLYMQNFRRHRVSPINPDLFGSLVWTLNSGGNGPYFTYNFNNFDASLERYIDEFGFNGLNLPIVPTSSQLNNYPRFGPQYQELYNQLMGPIMQHLRERGWLAPTYCWWYDEPDPYALANIVIPGMKSVGIAAPGLRRQLTREPIAELFGQVETWVPLTHWVWMELASFLERKAAGDSVAWYLASVPGAPYPNWLTDHPAINARVRSWMAEKFDLEGEMYWNVAWWIGDKHAPISPWTNSLQRIFDGNAVGNGNGALLFPPTRTPPTSLLVTNPIDTVRWELIREGMEDREYFWLLKQILVRREPVLGANHSAILQAKAARDAALGIILSRTYYESDPQKLYAGRKAVAEAIEVLDDDSPMMVRDPASRAVALGSNVVLRAEAIGWPLPAYQWKHYGTNVPGATNAVLTLMSFNSTHLGPWHVIASNSVGTATSATATLAGYWVPTPQIIAFSAGDNRRVGDRTVLEVTAVSSLPVTYRWYLNGVLLAGVTNSAWSITNLTANSAGVYTVTVSNLAGIATSGPVSIAVMPAYTNQTPAFAGSWAGAPVGFKLQLPVDNRPRTVLVSTNLANWSTQFVVNPSGLPQIVSDSTATNQPRKFYRVRAN